MPEQPPRELDYYSGVPVDDLSIVDDIVAYYNRFLNISSGEYGAGSPEEYDTSQYETVHQLLADINIEIGGIDGIATFEMWSEDPAQYKDEIAAFFEEEATREQFSGLRDQLKSESKALADTRSKQSEAAPEPTISKLTPLPLPSGPKPEDVLKNVAYAREEQAQRDNPKIKVTSQGGSKPAGKFNAKEALQSLKKDMTSKLKEMKTQAKEAIQNKIKPGPK